MGATADRTRMNMTPSISNRVTPHKPRVTLRMALASAMTSSNGTTRATYQFCPVSRREMG